MSIAAPAEIGASVGDDAAHRIKAKWGLWLNANLRRKTALARERASELVTLAQRSGDGDLLLEAYHCRWSTAFFRGDVAATLDDSRIGVETYDMARHRHLGLAFGGHDPGVCAHVVHANALQLVRRPGTGARQRCAGACPRRNARPSQQPRPRAPQSRHGPSACRRSRCHLCGRASRRGAGGKIWADAMASASSLLLTGWATAVGLRRRRRGATDRRRNRQGDGRRPGAAILSGLGGRSSAGRRPAGGRPRSSRPRDRRRSTNRASASICRKSIACAANACWRSTATTRTKRGRPSRPRAISPIGKARSSLNAAPQRRLPKLRSCMLVARRVPRWRGL